MTMEQKLKWEGLMKRQEYMKQWMEVQNQRMLWWAAGNKWMETKNLNEVYDSG